MKKLSTEDDKIIKDYCDAIGIPDIRTDKFNISYGRFLEAVVLPRGLAERRRKAGDPTARAGDFCSACGIGEDLRHRCCGWRAACPYAATAELEKNRAVASRDWARRQAVFREIAGEYYRALFAPDGQGLAEFARFMARRGQRYKKTATKITPSRSSPID